MKKSYTVIRFLVVLMMIAAFVACASTPQQSSTGKLSMIPSSRQK